MSRNTIISLTLVSLLAGGISAWFFDHHVSNRTAEIVLEQDEVPISTAFEKNLTDQDRIDLTNHCDRLAADPDDPYAVAEGTVTEDLSLEAAIEACITALEEDRDEPRYQFQLGRVLIEAERFEDALSFIEESADSGYPAAQAFLGQYYEHGAANLDVDLEYAAELYEAAAEGGYEPAQALAQSLSQSLAPALAPTPAVPSPAHQNAGQSIDLSLFEEPRIITALLRKDYSALNNYRSGFAIEDAGVQLGLITYLEGFSEAMKADWIGCPKVFPAGMGPAIKRWQVNSTFNNIGSATKAAASAVGGGYFTNQLPPQFAGLGLIADIAATADSQGPWAAVQQFQQPIIDGEAAHGTLKEKGAKDAKILRDLTHECTAPEARAVFSNLKEYVLSKS